MNAFLGSVLSNTSAYEELADLMTSLGADDTTIGSFH